MNRRLVTFLVLGCAFWVAFLQPVQADMTLAVGVVGPQYAFSFGNNVNAYYSPVYRTYLYGDGGLYYRWVDTGWVYGPAPVGPWLPLSLAVFLPPVLLYGPPPPVIVYRPYFVWWRMAVAPWYARVHPGWWMQHRVFLAHYALWRARVVPIYAAHPGLLWRRPGMRPIFTRSRIRQQRWRYTLRHPVFAAHHPALRARAQRYAFRHPGFVQRGPVVGQRTRFRRFVARHPRFIGHPYRARRVFRARRQERRSR